MQTANKLVLSIKIFEFIIFRSIGRNQVLQYDFENFLRCRTPNAFSSTSRYILSKNKAEIAYLTVWVFMMRKPVKYFTKLQIIKIKEEYCVQITATKYIQ